MRIKHKPVGWKQDKITSMHIRVFGVMSAKRTVLTCELFAGRSDSFVFLDGFIWLTDANANGNCAYLTRPS